MKRYGKPLCILALILFILFLTYVLITVLTLSWSDWNRSRFSDWPRDAEYTSLFWTELCMAVPLGQLWILCVSCCIRLFRKKPRRAIQNQKAWFWGLSVLLVLLTVLNIVNGRTYRMLNVSQEPSAKGYASIFYPFVMITEATLGAWIWLVLQWARGKISKRKNGDS